MKRWIYPLLLFVFVLAACQPATAEPTESPAVDNPPEQIESTAAPEDVSEPEPTATDLPEQPQPEELAEVICAETPPSTPGGEAISVVFTNNYSDSLDVYFKDSAGVENLVFRLEPGQSIIQGAAVGESYCFAFPRGGLGDPLQETLIELVAGDEEVDTVFSDAKHELAEIQAFDLPECRLRSRDTTNQDPIDVSFTNAGSRQVTVYWVDWDGNLTEDPFDVQPGATEFIPGVGHLHAWCVRDSQTGDFIYQNFTLAGRDEFLIPTAGMSEAVTLTLSLESFCREGPGPEYPEVGVISTDELVYVVGIPAESGYPWVVVLDNMAGATCWLWTEHATIEGDLDILPQVSIPPAP